jgi:hypothetical protein
LIVGLTAGTLSIFGTFLILSAAFAGIGLVVCRAFGLRTLNIDDCFLAFWVGFSVVILYLMMWNFALPVRLVTLLFVLAAGGAGLVWNWEALTRIFDNESWRPSLLLMLISGLASFWVANQCTAGFQSWDGALYHLQSVKWAKAYPIVPGIANLHGPLAFNNSSSLYDAMLDSGWWEGGGYHIANGLLLFVFVLQAMANGARLGCGGSSAATSRLYSFLLLAPALHLVRNHDISSYSTDVPMTLVLLATSAKMYDLVSARASQEFTPEDRYGIVALAILFASAVCIKLSVGVFAIVAMPIAIYLWWVHRPRQETGLMKTLVWSLVVIFAFAVVWIARGVVMSGYPFFPVSVAQFPVEWRAPVEHADAEYAFMSFTEREFSWTIGRDWFRHVIFGNPYAVFVPFCVAAFALFVLFVCRVFRYEARKGPKTTWWMLLPVVVAIGAWGWSVPATRYIVAVWWTLACVCLCECQREVWPHLGITARRLAISGCIVLGISPPLVEPAFAAIRDGQGAVLAVLHYNFVRPEPNLWVHPMAGQAVLTPFTTRSGLVLNVPNNPRLPQGCWDAPIPCTPNPAPNLQLRRPGQVEEGFRLDGGWQMHYWPYRDHTSFLTEWRKRRVERDHER